MMHVQGKENCSGCGACVAVCPVRCISMKEDTEGFLYLQIEISKCIDCGACDRSCQSITPIKTSTTPQAYTCINNDKKYWRSPARVAYSLFLPNGFCK